MFYIYILANQKNTVLYTGVTNNLKRRVYEHKEKLVPGFTKKYNVNNLVYCEFTENAESAISREKQIKNYSRVKKLELVSGFNCGWDDLYEKL
jgi:putative endonuclease